MMVIFVCSDATIILAALSWRRGWKKLALAPALFLVIIARIDVGLGSKLNDVLGFKLIVGSVCVTWIVYMVLIPPKAAEVKK